MLGRAPQLGRPTMQPSWPWAKTCEPSQPLRGPGQPDPTARRHLDWSPSSRARRFAGGPGPWAHGQLAQLGRSRVIGQALGQELLHRLGAAKARELLGQLPRSASDKGAESGPARRRPGPRPIPGGESRSTRPFPSMPDPANSRQPEQLPAARRPAGRGPSGRRGARRHWHCVSPAAVASRVADLDQGKDARMIQRAVCRLGAGRKKCRHDGGGRRCGPGPRRRHAGCGAFLCPAKTSSGRGRLGVAPDAGECSATWRTVSSASARPCRSTARAAGPSIRQAAQTALRRASADIDERSVSARAGTASLPRLASACDGARRTAGRGSPSKPASSAGVGLGPGDVSRRGHRPRRALASANAINRAQHVRLVQLRGRAAELVPAAGVDHEQAAVGVLQHVGRMEIEVVGDEEILIAAS